MFDWIGELGKAIEAKHGKEARDKIIGDTSKLTLDHESLAEWFEKFNHGLDELDDKDFLTTTIASLCPCRCPDIEENIRKNYEESKDLREFVDRIDKDGLFEDKVNLEGNVLLATKHPFSKYGKRDHNGPYTTTCHCYIGNHAEKSISDIYCHCCTVGYYGKMFKNALNKDINVELVESVLSGGKSCIAAIYLPEKSNSSSRR